MSRIQWYIVELQVVSWLVPLPEFEAIGINAVKFGPFLDMNSLRSLTVSVFFIFTAKGAASGSPWTMQKSDIVLG